MRNGFAYIVLWLMGIPLGTLMLVWVVTSLIGGR